MPLSERQERHHQRFESIPCPLQAAQLRLQRCHDASAGGVEREIPRRGIEGKTWPAKGKRQPRKAEVSGQAQVAAETWKAALGDRKRAFSSLGSKAVTAYKKRRKADRNRVEKKFFLDNGLPAPQPEDIAENDAGLPRASSSTRATFVEQWCKFGSFAICKQCRSLQPRPLEPMDTRRVAPAERTAKACKQCRAGQWVPQPEDIPRPLKKLSVKLSKVLRSLLQRPALGLCLQPPTFG